MTCIDPALSERLFESEPRMSKAWVEHLAACRGCRVLHAMLPGAIERSVLDGHPSAEVLLACDSTAPDHDSAVHPSIAGHLAGCAVCRDALEEVPDLGLPASRAWPRISSSWVVAAAGWLLAAVFFPWTSQSGERSGPALVLSSETVTLSAQRGAEVPTVAGKTDLVRMQLVLGEDVAVRDSLQIRVTTASGAAIVDGLVVVSELGEHGWPVVLLDRRLVPAGRLTVRVVSPHRVESQFTLDLK